MGTAMSAVLPAPLAMRVFAAFASGYFMSYALRSVNAVIAPDLIVEFGLSNAQLGSLSSAYFIAFAAMQMPLGIWLDRFGSRRVDATLLLVAAAGCAVFTAGRDAYTKRVETALLSEPKMLAKPVAQLPYAQKLRVEEVQGSWLRVSDGRRSGWVFAGNLAEQKPSATKGLDGLPLAASATTASTAARPLTPTSSDYSERRGLADAAADLQWLEQQHALLPTPTIQEFLKTEKKGEFQ